MAELPVEMPNLLNFPMDKLCYDLVLEVIDELDPKDVPELMKVDRRFRWILLQKPGRIFGKQIHLISVEIGERRLVDAKRKRYRELVFIMKFAESRAVPFDVWSHKVLLLSQIERCSVLFISDVYVWYDALEEEELSAFKKAFANLKQVDELEVNIWENNFNDFLRNLKAQVTDRASLKFTDSQDETHPQLILSLINRSLQSCKMISVDLYDEPDFYPTLFSALSKTQLELFVTEVYCDNVELTIELILNFGIPSGNKEAACFVRGEMLYEIDDLIENFPEIRQVNGRNKTFIRDTMMETLRKHRIMDRSRSNSPRSVSVSAESLSISEDSRSDSDHSLHSMDLSPIKRRVEHDVSLGGPFDCYLKGIDERRDCIYVVNHKFFFAKYVSSIQF